MREEAGPGACVRSKPALRPRRSFGDREPSLQYESMSLRHFLERYFEFAALGANWRTEILAGFTTFMTMAYVQL